MALRMRLRRAGWMSLLTLIIIGLASVMLSVACGDDEEEGPPGNGQLSKSDVVLHHSFSPSGQHVPLYLAIEMGFYAEEGLNVEIRSGGGSSEVLGTLAAGQLDFAYAGSDSAITLIRQDAPIKSVMDIWATHPAVLYALPETDLDEPSDLEGKSLLEEEGSGDDIRNAIFMERNGVDRSQVDIRTLGQVDAVNALLLAGQVDVVQGFVNDSTIALEFELGEEIPQLLMADWGLNTVARGIYVNNSMIESNPDTIAAFVRATIRSYEYTRDNLDEAVQVFVDRFPEQDADFIRAAVERTLDLVDFDNLFSHDEARFRETEDLFIEAGVLEARADDVNVYFTNEFLP